MINANVILANDLNIKSTPQTNLGTIYNTHFSIGSLKANRPTATTARRNHHHPPVRHRADVGAVRINGDLAQITAEGREHVAKLRAVLMAHPPEKRMELRTAYIHGGLPLEACGRQGRRAVRYRAQLDSVAARKEGDDWDKFRAASLIVAGGGIEQAMGRIIAAGLMRCEALLERVGEIEDPAAAADAINARRYDVEAARGGQVLRTRKSANWAVAIERTLKALAVWADQRRAGARAWSPGAARRLRHGQEAADCRAPGRAARP